MSLVQNGIVGEQMANTASLRYDLCKSASTLQHSEPKFPALLVPALKELFRKGLSRGIIAEVNGRRSSGRTAMTFHVLAEATARGEICAVIDLYDSFHPTSAAAAGVQLDRILWVRCRGNAEHAIRAADLLLHAGGFGLVLLDLCEATPRILNRIPLSYWYRFRRAVEHTPTILLLCADGGKAKSCSSVAVQLQLKKSHWSGQAPFLLLRSIQILASLQRAFAGSSVPDCSLEAVA